MEDWELILKYIRKEVTVSEKETVEKWLVEDKANTELFAEIKNTWETSAKIEKPIKIDKTEAWRSIQEKIKEQSAAAVLKEDKTSNAAWFMRIAAVLVIASFSTWLFLQKSEKEVLITFKSGSESKMLVLSDCTHVFLNANSTFVYPEVFDAGTRNVSLSGEAFFEVTKDAKKPFIIKNKDFDVTVLGTSFNVSAYTGNADAVVTVVSGKVAFNDPQGNSLILIKNETGVLNKETKQIKKSPNADSNFLAWKTKKIEFRNTAFKDVCETLKKYFSIQIEIKNENILKCKFTGYFENPSLEEILSVLEKTLDVKALVNDKQVVLTGKGC